MTWEDCALVLDKLSSEGQDQWAVRCTYLELGGSGPGHQISWGQSEQELWRRSPTECMDESQA